MTVTGTVIKVIHRPTPHGSVYLTVDVQGDSGHVSRLRYLKSFTTAPARGQRVRIDGMPLMGFPKANIGAETVTVLEGATS